MLVLFREHICKERALIQDDRLRVIDAQVFTYAPNHRGNRRMPTPDDLVLANDCYDQFSHRTLDEKWIGSFVVGATSNKWHAGREEYCAHGYAAQSANCQPASLALTHLAE